MVSGFQIINPADGSPVRTHPSIDAETARDRIAAAHEAWLDWRITSFEARGNVLNRAADILDRDIEALAARITQEMGKPITEARAEVSKCALVCRHYARHAASMLLGDETDIDTARVQTVHAAIGVVFAIMPWNFPLWQVFRSAAPGLMAGNAFALKHAPNVLGCGQDITRLLGEAGLPKGLFTDLPIDVDVAAEVIADPRVRGVTLTGSGRAGSSVAKHAGRHLKKCVLELGGSDAAVVLADADVESAARSCVASRMLNAGQVCIAAKRFIVVDAVYDDFAATVIDLMSDITPGNPADDTCRLGPLARQDLRDTVHAQVVLSIEAGATLRLGGTAGDQPGWWYPPTVLEDVAPGMPAFDEEVFGPVAALIRARDEHHAIELANATSYGLAGSVYTADVQHGRRLAADRIDAGFVSVNDFPRSDPRIAFGGTKDSGFGRELGAPGIREFTNLKSVYVAS